MITRKRVGGILVALLLVAGCGASSTSGDVSSGNGVVDSMDVSIDYAGADLAVDSTVDEADAQWEFDRGNYEPVHGWILLDSDLDSVLESIEEAHVYGVNQIQLSHDLIMELEEIVDDPEAAQTRIDTLNLGINKAHEYGMKAFIWSHELSGVDLDVCYSSTSLTWQKRAQAYASAFELLPGLDGVVMMFGSSPVSPWFSICSCDWCMDNYGPNPLTAPSNEERIRIIVEELGDVIVNQFGKELMIRTFVHQPDEITWHGVGLQTVTGVEFTGMHKGPVQDWEPYNPHHPNTGNIGNHPSVLELDLAGEYYGKAVLPFCAPGYYWYRMNYLWEHKGIGVVSRVQRGANHALHTPNEINLWAVKRLVEDIDTPLDTIWNEFIENFYGVSPNDPGQAVLKEILEDTFPIRRKSHYVLGIWALEKSSDFPDAPVLDQFNDRGKMPKWDPDWQGVWDSLDEPNEQTLRLIWQEGTESVVMSEHSLAQLPQLETVLDAEQYQDLRRRLTHQYLAARAWRGIDIILFARRAKAPGMPTELFDAWILWGRQELSEVIQAMNAAGLSGVLVASPERLTTFLSSVGGPLEEVDPVEAPAQPLFSPVNVVASTDTSAILEFSTELTTPITLEYGLEIPDYGQIVELGVIAPGSTKSIELSGLIPDTRYVVRLKTEWEGMTLTGGDFWVYTH